MLAEKHFPPDAFDVEEHRYIHPFALPFGVTLKRVRERRGRRDTEQFGSSVAMNYS